jgi:hypothetical protein
MPFTAITPITPTGPYPAGGTVGATALNVTETATDNVNGNSFPLTGHDVLLLHNTDTVAHTVTINSAPDQRGRSADITNYSIPASTIAAFHFRGASDGWAQTDGTIHFTANNALIKAFVLTFPT